MGKLNCWEFFNCGRESGGKNAEKLGICPTASTNIFEGVNEGQYAGRFCWRVAGTYCKGEAQGTYAKKFKNCVNCEFLKLVNNEEGTNFILYPKKIG